MSKEKDDKAKDDLEAVRTVTVALEGFGSEAQERIIRWSRERLGLAPAPKSDTHATPFPAIRSETPAREMPEGQQAAAARSTDLRTFVDGKKPKSDVQFAAVVAYYYRFQAPPAEHKDEIDAEILLNSCRLTERDRLPKPGQTLRNAKKLGLLDSGTEAGKFVINTVGENLVAMALPGEPDNNRVKPNRRKKPNRKNKPSKK